MKYIKKYIKRLIFSFFLLYGYNKILMPINMEIPINIYTILILSVFGIPVLIILVLVKIMFFI